MTARATSKKARALAVLVVAGAAIWAVSSFYLADTGSNTVNIQPASNLGNGSPFQLTSISSTVTRPNGNASIQAGVAIARVVMVKGYGNRLKVDVAWLDPRDSSQVLNNPNAQIYAGLFHPVAQGTSCTPASPSVSDTQATITDDLGAGNVQYCTEIDPGATGSMMIKDTGTSKLALSPTNISGYIASSLSDSSTIDCTATNNDTWCHPTALAASGGFNYNVVWLVLTIVTPQGKPAGQQNNVSSLSFFTQAKSL